MSYSAKVTAPPASKQPSGEATPTLGSHWTAAKPHKQVQISLIWSKKVSTIPNSRTSLGSFETFPHSSGNLLLLFHLLCQGLPVSAHPPTFLPLSLTLPKRLSAGAGGGLSLLSAVTPCKSQSPPHLPTFHSTPLHSGYHQHLPPHLSLLPPSPPPSALSSRSS